MAYLMFLRGTRMCDVPSDVAQAIDVAHFIVM